MANTVQGNEFEGWVNPFSATDTQNEFSGWVNPFQTQEKGEGRGIGGIVSDLGVSAAAGSNALMELAGTLYGLTTGDMENYARQQGARGREYWNSRKTPELKQLEADRKSKVDAADGQLAKLGTAFWETFSSPSLLAAYTFEQIPNLIVTGGAGRAAGAGVNALFKKTGQDVSEKVVNRAASAGAVTAGGAMQGADVGGQAYDELMALPDSVWLANPRLQERINGNMDLFPRAKREIAAELSRTPAIASGVMSIGLNSLPIFRILEDRLAGVPGSGSRLANAAKGFAGESLGEGVEEGSGVALSNVAVAQIDPTKSISEGVGEAAGMGMAAGPMGAIAGLTRGDTGAADVTRSIFEAPDVDSAIDAANSALDAFEMPGVDFEAPNVPRPNPPGYDTIPGAGMATIEFDDTGMPILTEEPGTRPAPGAEIPGVDFRTRRDDETDAAYAARMEQEQAARDRDFPAAMQQKAEQDMLRADLSTTAAPENPAIANALLGAYLKQAPESTQSAVSARPATDVLAAIDRLAVPASVRTVTMPSGNPFPSEKVAKSSMSYRNNPGSRVVPAQGGGFQIEIPGKSDQEWRQFTPETGTLGVPRETMPQIKAEHRGAMVNFLKGRFISSEIQQVPAKTLKPTQAEFSPAKVKQALEYEGGNRSILVSSDNFVVDGHHQWLAGLDGDIQVIRIDAPVQEILDVIKEFPSATSGEVTATPAYSNELIAFARKAKSLAEVREFARKQFGPRAPQALEQAITGAWNIRNQEKRRRIGPDDSMATAIAKLGGIKTDWQQDITGDTKANKMIPGVGQVFSKNGTSPDDMAVRLLEEGYITQAEYDNMDGRDAIYEALNEELAGGRKKYKLDSLKAQEEMLQDIEDEYEQQEEAMRAQREQAYAEIEQEYGVEAAERARLYDEAQDNIIDDLLSDIDILNQLNQEREDARETDGEPGITFDEATGNREPIRGMGREESGEPSQAARGQAQDRGAAGEVAPGSASPRPEITIQIAADSIEKLRASDVERVIFEAFQVGEDHLMDVYLYISSKRPDLAQSLKDAFDDVAGFVTDSSNRMLAAMAKSAMRRITGENEKQAILDKYGDDLSGLQLSSNDGERFALFTPDPGEKGKVRASYFFKGGFSGHSTRDTYAKLLDEMFQDGYRKEAPGKFEELSQTKEFADGNEYASLIQQVNSGQITHKQMLEGLEKKKASEKPAAKEMTDLTDAEYKAILEDARYLKDVTYSLSGFDGVTIDQKLKLNDALGNKSSRDALLMRAFGISRSAAHDINNSLDAKPVRKLRPVDIQEAFEKFPGLKDSADEILGADGQHVVELMAAKKPAKRSRITPETAGDMKNGDIVVDDNGNEFVAMGSRHKWMDAAPIVNGKAQVSADTMIRFHLVDEGRDLYEGRNFSPIYATGRNLYEDQVPRTQAAASSAGKIEYSNPSVETFSSWTKQVPVVSTINGWKIFDDTRIGNQFVVMKKVRERNAAGGGYESVMEASGFKDQAAAEKWARENDSTPKAASSEAVSVSGKEKKPPKGYGENNKLVTKDRADELRKKLKDKLKNQLSSGIDPEIMAMGAELAAFHIEAGARKFADFAAAVAEDLGVSVADLKRYLRSWYNGARDMMEDSGIDVSGMDSAAQVREQFESIVGDQTNAQRPATDSPADSQAGQEQLFEADPVDGRRGRGGRAADEAGAQTGNAQEGSGAAMGERRAPADRKRSNQPVRSEKSRLEADSAGDSDGSGSLPGSTGGLFDDRETGSDVGQVSAKAPAASPVIPSDAPKSVTPANLSEIKKQMPFLTEGQADDVAFAEKRLSKPDGFGVLFTNGTGTGKTFTGLGIVKRSVMAGRSNILVIAPKQPIVDAWTKAGKAFFGLQISKLDSIRDAGKGVVVTTYANIGDNDELLNRDWDLIVADESHYLSSAGDGKDTKALDRIRELTLKRNTARGRVYGKNRALVDQMNAMNSEAEMMRKSDNQEYWYRAGDIQDKADAIRKQLDAMVDAERERIKGVPDAAKPRAVFLSATPFAYEKSVQWANEFLFDWGTDDSGMGYNSGGNYEKFMMTHFGYRMRYNKLTEPDEKVDRGLMQRAFNSWLKREGVLSSRALDSEFDYDRLFVYADNPIGKRVDDAIDWLREKSGGEKEIPGMQEIYEKMIEENFDYHARMYFLEAIKAREAVPQIKAHLAMGRKVLVMHDFKKGGVSNPFRIGFDSNASEMRSAYEMFREEFSDLINAFDYIPSPISLLTREFPRALVYNGSIPAKKRIDLQNQFNSDADGSPMMMIAQGDAMREGVSIHDTSGKHPRVMIHLGMPTKPTAAIQQEGRIYRTGQASNAMFRYLTIGSSWERFAFASRIASRASAAENLAMGEQARGLKDAFISAYEEADSYLPGFEGEGTGGKERDAAFTSALTPWDTAKSYYFGTKKYQSGRGARGREHSEFFATPEPVGMKMVQWADIRAGESVLEPSAGLGAIARWFPENARNRAIEFSNDLSSRLALHFEGDLMTGDFMDHNIVNKYDAIVMNPPFGQGGKQAAEHVAKALIHLRDNGRVVALIPTGPAADKHFDKLLYDNKETADIFIVADIKLPSVTFERAGTSVSTRILVLEKQTDKEKQGQIRQVNRDYSGAETIEELFDRIEGSTIPPRSVPEQVDETPVTSRTAKPVVDKDAVQAAQNSAPEGHWAKGPIIEHTTGKGKVITGVIAKIDFAAAKAIDPYTFKKDGGYFIREKHIPGAVFSRADSRRSAIPIDRAQALVSAITGRLENAPEVIVVRSMQDDQVPEAVRREDARQRSQGASGEPEGFYYRGKAYIVLDGLSRRKGENDAQALLRVFSHEILGHAGLRGLFRSDLDAVLNEVSLKRLSDVRKKAAEYGLDMADKRQRMEAAEEVLAEMAQTQPENSLVTKAIEAVRRALRRLLMRLPADIRAMLGGGRFTQWVNAMTDAEIIDRFIVPAREFIRGGNQAGLNAMPAFMRTGPWYRSELQNNIGQIRQMASKQGMIGKEQAAQWIDAAIKKGLFKAEEVEWTGLREFIDLSDDRLSVDDIQAFVDGNGVRVETVVLQASNRPPLPEGWEVERQPNGEYYLLDQDGEVVSEGETEEEAIDNGMDSDELQDRPEAAGRTKYASYQLPGGENYREVLLTLPAQVPTELPDGFQAVEQPGKEGSSRRWIVTGPGPMAVNQYASGATRAEAISKFVQHGHTGKPVFKSAHWDQPNVLAHVRMNDRIDVDGNKVLFIEEIQSDWAQEGRKHGFGPRQVGKVFKQENGDNWGVRWPDGSFSGGFSREGADRAALGGKSGKSTPAAPFVTNTKAWTSLALKRILAIAAEGDYDKVAFVNGEQSADRYDLSKKLRSITATKIEAPAGNFYSIEAKDAAGKIVLSGGKTHTADELSDVIGKEMAEKIINQKEDTATYSGLDLKVGGEGMKAFYDQIIPATLKDLSKKLGGGPLEMITIVNQEEDFDYEDLENATDDEMAQLQSGGVSLSQPGITITDAMREKVASGLPLFSRDMGDGQDDFNLEQYTEEEISQREQMGRDRKAQIAKALQKKDADDQLDEFVLTGSDSVADQAAARGQGSLFSRSKALPDTIDIDGVQRPTTNSNGQPIAQTEEGVRNFWAWFGDSKVVDDQGSPLRVYHGTKSQIDSFRPGSWFAEDAKLANTYVGGGRMASPKARKGSNVVPAFLSIQNPLDVTGRLFDRTSIREILSQEGLSESEMLESLDYMEEVAAKEHEKRGYSGLTGRHYGTLSYGTEPQDKLYALNKEESLWSILDDSIFRAALQRLGYDGVKADEKIKAGDDPVAIWQVFNSEQVKSAIGNTGAFDPADNDIRFSRSTVMDSFEQEAESEFSEENRRLREADKTLWNKAKTLLRREFAPGGLLPDSIFREKIARDGKLNVVEITVQSLVKEIEESVRKEYGAQLRNLNETDMRRLSDALSGKMPANMKERTKTAIVAMRQYIDHLSEQYTHILRQQIDDLSRGMDDGELMLLDAFLRAGQIEPEGNLPSQKAAATRQRNKIMEEAKEAATAFWGDGKKMQAALGKAAQVAERASLMNIILNNQGQYVHRSYQVFDDPYWFRKIDPAVFDNAMNYLIERYLEDGTMSRQEAIAKAEKVIDQIVKTDTAYNDMESFIKESKLGAKDLSVLKKRKDIAPEIRALMGEYIDPRINFAKTATKMGRLIFNQKFLDNVLEKGMGTFLFTEEEAPVGTEEIAAEGSEVYAPLNGLYAPREVIQAFKDVMGKEQMADWYRMIVQFNGLVKGGKTILSPTTSARNFQSAMFFALANGHWDLTQAKKSMALYRTFDSPAKLAYVKKMIELGVIYDNPHAQEMMALLSESKFDSMFASSQTAETIRNAWNLARDIYSFGDDFWKVIGFENEKAKLMKHAGMSEAAAEKEAADRIRNLYPTYSMVGSAIQWLRRFPLVGTFVSFPAEIIRTSANMVRTVRKDWKTSGMRRIAIDRALGMAFVSGFAYAAQEIAKAMFDIDDDDEEAIRLQAAPWQRNSNLVITGRDEEGNLQYFDISFLDPYNYFKRPITAIMRDQPMGDALVSAASDMLSPFLGTDIAAGAIMEVYANKTGTGGPVYKESDSLDRQLIDIAQHLRKALQPGFVSNLERTYQALDGQTNASGKKFDLGDEGLSWIGWRVSTLDPKTALYYRSFEFSDAKAEASKTLTEVLNDPNDVSPASIESAYERAVKMRAQAYNDMSKIVGASRRSGLSATQIRMVLKSGNVSEQDRQALIDGSVPAWRPTQQAETAAVRRAEALIGREKAMEIRARYRMVRTLD